MKTNSDEESSNYILSTNYVLQLKTSKNYEFKVTLGKLMNLSDVSENLNNDSRHHFLSIKNLNGEPNVKLKK